MFSHRYLIDVASLTNWRFGGLTGAMIFGTVNSLVFNVAGVKIVYFDSRGAIALLDADVLMANTSSSIPAKSREGYAA